MFIDIHVHVRRTPGPLRRGKPANATPAQLIERYDALDIERAVLLPGTDICAPDTPTPLVDFLIRLRDESRIGEEVFQKVARENAIRLLGLI